MKSIIDKNCIQLDMKEKSKNLVIKKWLKVLLTRIESMI